jgi:non-heme chloroperoxidase
MNMSENSESSRTRREVLGGAAAMGVASLLRVQPSSAADGRASLAAAGTVGSTRSGRFKTKDGTEIYFNDWGSGPAILFSHGWPLSADAFEDQMFFFASRGYRCVAHDRRGHGRSSQPWRGNDMDTYADDLAELMHELNVRKAVIVGHSSGGGEVARYIGRYGTERLRKAVLISSIPPVMVQSNANPGGTPLTAFDDVRAKVSADRSQFFKDVSMPFYGYNRPGAKVSEGVTRSFWLQGMMAGFPASYFSVAAFSETDFTADLKKFDVPTLVLHGENDQMVPISDSAFLSAKLIRDAQLVILEGAPHGVCTTHKDRVNAELLAFIEQ